MLRYESLRARERGTTRRIPHRTSKISDTETVFIDIIVYKGTRFKNQSILDVKTYLKPTDFTSRHPPSVKNGFAKGEGLRLLRKKFLKGHFREKKKSKFKRHLQDRGYPRNLVEKLLFTKKGSVLIKGDNKTQKDI